MRLYAVTDLASGQEIIVDAVDARDAKAKVQARHFPQRKWTELHIVRIKDEDIDYLSDSPVRGSEV